MADTKEAEDIFPPTPICGKFLGSNSKWICLRSKNHEGPCSYKGSFNDRSEQVERELGTESRESKTPFPKSIGPWSEMNQRQVDGDHYKTVGGRQPADERQVGGDHYQTRTGESHWDMMWRLYREAWFVGNITKYVLRYRKKNGVKDLEKAQHYLDKLLELENADLKAEEGQVP